MRYLTRRYIGEYRSKTDLLYRQTISLDSGLLDVEIVDVSAETDNEFPIEQIQWADSCLIVYSITDRESFKYATHALGNLKSLQNGPSAYLIGNKADLDHLREVRKKYPFIVSDSRLADLFTLRIFVQLNRANKFCQNVWKLSSCKIAMFILRCRCNPENPICRFCVFVYFPLRIVVRERERYINESSLRDGFY